MNQYKEGCLGLQSLHGQDQLKSHLQIDSYNTTEAAGGDRESMLDKLEKIMFERALNLRH